MQQKRPTQALPEGSTIAARRVRGSLPSPAGKAGWARAACPPLWERCSPARQARSARRRRFRLGQSRYSTRMFSPWRPSSRFWTARRAIQEAVVGVEPNLWLIPCVRRAHRLPKQPDQRHARAISSEFSSSVRGRWISSWSTPARAFRRTCFRCISPEFESVVMLTPEPTALTDAYGLIKLLRRRSGIRRASVIVNQVTDGREGSSDVPETQGSRRQIRGRPIGILGSLAEG